MPLLLRSAPHRHALRGTQHCSFEQLRNLRSFVGTKPECSSLAVRYFPRLGFEYDDVPPDITAAGAVCCPMLHFMVLE